MVKEKIAKRFDRIMYDIGCEHLMVLDPNSEINQIPKSYGVEDGITLEWMLKEAKYWLSCYYEGGHCRCDDRFLSKEDYKIWLSETGKLKRLIKAIEKEMEGTK